MRLSLALLATALLLPLAAPAEAGGPQAAKNLPLPRYGNAALLRNLPEGELVETAIRRVEVYPDGALIERRGEVELETGERRLVVPALPEALEARSLSISGFGKEAVAGSTFLEAGTLVESRPKELQEIEQVLAGLEAEDRRLAAREWALEQRRSLVLAAAGKAQALPGEALWKTLDAAEQEFLRLDQELARLDAQRRELTPRLEAARSEHEALRTRLERPVKHVVVEVSVRNRVKLPLVLRYYLRGPSWRPRHVARYDGETGVLLLETSAFVTQSTGEGWQQVEMVVSTARPGGGLLPPEWRPLEVRLEKESTAVAAESLRARDLDLSGAGPVETGARSFLLPEPVSLESGDRGRNLRLEVARAQARAERVALPQTAPGVFLRLELANPLITPLLPGEAALFNGSDYVGSATLPGVLPGQTLVLPFGRDPALGVERTRTARRAETSGKQQVVRHEYRFRALNRLGRSVEILVREVLPASRERSVRVVVEPGQTLPEASGRDPPAGGQEWRVNVPAGGERAWDFAYVVSGPAGQRLLGVD